jgi:hypothetical protein
MKKRAVYSAETSMSNYKSTRRYLKSGEDLKPLTFPKTGKGSWGCKRLETAASRATLVHKFVI